MKIIIMFIMLTLLLNDKGLASTLTSSDSTHIDSVYQTLLKLDFDKYRGKKVKDLLIGIGIAHYKIVYAEEPTLHLAHIEIYYKGSDAYIEIDFEYLEHVPRYSKHLGKRAWENDEAIIEEKINRIVLWNNKVKLYPEYIKKLDF
jgi:hypothetical protein